MSDVTTGRKVTDGVSARLQEVNERRWTSVGAVTSSVRIVRREQVGVETLAWRCELNFAIGSKQDCGERNIFSVITVIVCRSWIFMVLYCIFGIRVYVLT